MNNDSVLEEDINDIGEYDEKNDVDHKVVISKDGEWKIPDIAPKRSINCIVPIELVNKITAINNSMKNKFGSSMEFSIYLSGKFDDYGQLVVEDKIYIPKQRVSSASVEYDEEPTKEFNGVLHKHPNNITNFSGTDDSYINSHFDFSLLYVNDKIHMGIININYYKNFRLRFNLDITVVTPQIDINIDNIERYVVTQPVFQTPKYPLVKPYDSIGDHYPTSHYLNNNSIQQKKSKKVTFPNNVNVIDDDTEEESLLRWYQDIGY